MEMALEEARIAFDEDEVPIGAVIVHFEQGVIARAAQPARTVARPDRACRDDRDSTQASAALRSWRLEACALYVTLEPCPMCAGGIVQARLPLVFYGCADQKAGACHTLYSITNDSRLNHRCGVLGGILADECAGILREFFLDRRAEGKK